MLPADLWPQDSLDSYPMSLDDQPKRAQSEDVDDDLILAVGRRLLGMDPPSDSAGEEELTKLPRIVLE